MTRSQNKLEAEIASPRHDERASARGLAGWVARKLLSSSPFPSEPPEKPSIASAQEVAQAAATTVGIQALLSATSGAERRRVAKRYPELRPQPPFFSDLVIEVLTLVYWEGLSFEETAHRVGLSASHVRQKAPRELRYVALNALRPDFGYPPHTRFTDTRLERFTNAHTGVERRFTAQRYPELETLLNRLEPRDAQTLRGLYWEGKTYREVGAGLGNSVAAVQQRADRALAKLDRLAANDTAAGSSFHQAVPRTASEEPQPHLDENHLTTVLLALNSAPTLAQAAEQVGVSPEALDSYIDRMGIAAATVYEVSRD